MDNLKKKTFENGVEIAPGRNLQNLDEGASLSPVAGDPGDDEEDGAQQGRFCCKGNQKKFVNGPCPPGWHQCNQ